MDEKSIENLRNWLRERRNKQLDRAYRDARRYLGIPVLSQNFSSDSASSVTGTEKIFLRLPHTLLRTWTTQSTAHFCSACVQNAQIRKLVN